MRLKKCKKCGKVFKAESKGTYMCPACSAEIKRDSVVRLRTCRECGVQFYGGPRAWYCPECRERRLKTRRKMYRSQKYSTRPLGSIDICKKCGKEYVVKAGLQVYCPECAENAVREKVNAHKRQYMSDNKDKYAPHKAEMRSNGWVCAVCGKVFDKDSATVTCSEECARTLQKIRQQKADFCRGKRSIPPGEAYESGLPKSGIVGITWHRQRKKWQVKYKETYLGLYSSLDEAKEALDKYQEGGNVNEQDISRCQKSVQ